MPSTSSSSPKEGTHSRSACTECSRRKQKCNREWPCNHCQKRKVADKCRFNHQPAAEKAAKENFRKRRLNVDSTIDSVESDIDEAEGDGIDVLGYMPSHVLFGLTAQDEVTRAASRVFMKDPKIFPPLERALQVIPPRPYADNLVQNFLENVNYHYYIVYPASFLEQYHQWWIARSENRPLSVQWTCLLLMVCACASQYTSIELQKKLEEDLGDTIQRITEQYHEAARELSSTIPIGYSHLVNVQQLLHSCYWFKSEARFVECWHVLNSAIREAQELSFHQESKADTVPEFELEIRRRVWCVLDTWDWQISALLGRPMIIDRADIDVGLPGLTLEGTPHSPLTHMKLQSSLIRTIFRRFGLTKNVTQPEEVQEYQGIIKKWIKDFPPPFDVNNPDKSLDESCPWIVLHRHYIRTMAFSMLLDPVRVFLARPFTINAKESEVKIRNDGIDYCLELMISLRGFFYHVYPRDSKFHFVLFCIFDTSTVLCSSILHDDHHTLPRRDDVFKAIDDAHDMLTKLRMVTRSARTSYGILHRIFQRLPRLNVATALKNADSTLPEAKRVRVNDTASSSTGSVSAKTSSQQPTSLPTSASNGGQLSDVSCGQAMPPGYSQFNDTNVCVDPMDVASAGASSVGICPTALAHNKFVSAPQIPYAAASHASNVVTTSRNQDTADLSQVSDITSAPIGSLPVETYGPLPTAQLELKGQNLSFAPEVQDAPASFELPNEQTVFSSFSEEDLGELATLWHFESLDFDFLGQAGPSAQ